MRAGKSGASANNGKSKEKRRNSNGNGRQRRRGVADGKVVLLRKENEGSCLERTEEVFKFSTFHLRGQVNLVGWTKISFSFSPPWLFERSV